MAGLPAIVAAKGGALKIHEYQAKEILARYGVPVPRSHLAHTVSEAVAHARQLGSGVCVVKAQIHAGGRGKGGGVRVCKSIGEVETAARAILGMKLITHQTGPGGQEVKKVLIEEGCAIERELYLGMVIDRARETPSLMASAAGGMDIEKVAAEDPTQILIEPVHSPAGLEAYQGRRLGARLGVPGPLLQEFGKLAVNFARAFLAEDCSLAEINPLVLTKDQKLIALDAKINFDDNALYRHPESQQMRDLDEENPLEVRATDAGLNYIKMDGDIGCMVNGAGLAMATMDIIKLKGGEPANFLDVGGGATRERVSEAFRIILEDAAVRAILVNIFGGIVRCDLIAAGVVEAARELEVKIPVVVRLEGNKVAEGMQILGGSGLNIIAAADLEDAAVKAVGAARTGGRR